MWEGSGAGQPVWISRTGSPRGPTAAARRRSSASTISALASRTTLNCPTLVGLLAGVARKHEPVDLGQSRTELSEAP
jgi:hypothetical protein